MTTSGPADRDSLTASLSTAISNARRLAIELQAVHDSLDAAATDYRVRATRYRFDEAARACRYAADELQRYRGEGFPLPLPRPDDRTAIRLETACSPANA
jgi:hypothetical protein